MRGLAITAMGLGAFVGMSVAQAQNVTAFNPYNGVGMPVGATPPAASTVEPSARTYPLVEAPPNAGLAFNPWRTTSPTAGAVPALPASPNVVAAFGAGIPPPAFTPSGVYPGYQPGAGLPPPPPGPIESRVVAIPERGDRPGARKPVVQPPPPPPPSPVQTTSVQPTPPPKPAAVQPVPIQPAAATAAAPPPTPPVTVTVTEPPRNAGSVRQTERAAAPPPPAPVPQPPAPIAKAEPPPPRTAALKVEPAPPPPPAPAPTRAASPAPPPPATAPAPPSPPPARTATNTVPAPDVPASPPVAPSVTLSFAPQSAEINESGRNALDTMARSAAQRGVKQIELRAYATGTDTADARKVALARALSVRSYLIDHGVKARIEVGAFATAGRGPGTERVEITLPPP